MNDPDRDDVDARSVRELANAVRDLVLQEGEPGKVLEFHYWSREPGMLECIRAIAAMPMEARSALQAFLTAFTGHIITASLDSAGTLNLRPPDQDEIAGPPRDHPSRLAN